MWGRRMSQPHPAPEKVRFGPFELDRESGELLRDGTRIRLQDQPFQILCILLEQPGRVVSREELKNRVWPANTFVEFDQGLYSGIRRLRDALCDSAESPRYIETLARRGYRFVAPVEEHTAPPETPSAGLSERIRWRVPLDEALTTHSQGPPSNRTTTDASAWFQVRPRKPALWITAGLLIFAGIAAWQLRGRKKEQAVNNKTVALHRLTDFVGLEEFPAISPDGRTVAFTADTEPNRQIWVRLIAGGRPLQITRDSAEHLYPRWTQDSASIVYYTSTQEGQAQGMLWEISALGGTPRQLAKSLSGADVSHDGKNLAFFRLSDRERVEFVVFDRDRSQVRVLVELPPRFEYNYPRWSPDDRSIAYQRKSLLWADDIFLVPASGGEPRQITREGVLLGGLCWLPDGSGVLYSSARGSTILYLPTMHLWSTGVDRFAPKQVTYGETSLETPDIARGGKVIASRLRVQYQIWKFPVDGTAMDNVRRGKQITQQTSIVQTPSVAPDGHQLAYLSDEGGHGNVWIMNLDTKETRQLTSEHDPRVTVGVPVWSPDGANIALVSTRDTPNWDFLGLWVISPDGSNLRRLAEQVSGFATWSSDGRWLYYTKQTGDTYQILKTEVAYGASVVVRTDNGWSSAIAPDGSALYYMVPLLNVNGIADHEVRVARPDNGLSRALTRIAGRRVPHWQNLQAIISHSGKWLTLPLNDGVRTNLWLLSTADGKLRQLTDFGQRRTLIARRVSWSPDDRYVFAAVGDADADIIEMEELLP
jgi:Tol biopolymer transport system component/DNA-binding winged helix-turn-helix (wHTH) protein